MKVWSALLLVGATTFTGCKTVDETPVSQPQEGRWEMPKGFTPSFGGATAWECVSEKTKEVYVITGLDRKKNEAKMTIKGDDRDIATTLYVYADGYMGWGDDKYKQPVNSVLIEASKDDRSVARAFVQEDYGDKYEELLTCKVVDAR